MVNTFNKEALFALIKNLYSVIGIRISILDTHFDVVTEYPVEAPDICALIRTTEVGQNACRTCDKSACERAQALGKPHVYQCHAGITEAITPIQGPGSLTMGYAIFAHMLPEENHNEAMRTISEKCRTYGIEDAAVTAAVRHLKTQNTEKIMGSIFLLDMLTSYLHRKNLVNWRAEELSVQIKEFIDTNITKGLTGEMLCQYFCISRTKLYQLSMSTFGMSVMQYINFRRVENAKKLLENKEISVMEVANSLGFSDYHYFYRIFKKQTNMPPVKYRASLIKT